MIINCIAHFLYNLKDLHDWSSIALKFNTRTPENPNIQISWKYPSNWIFNKQKIFNRQTYMPEFHKSCISIKIWLDFFLYYNPFSVLHTYVMRK